MEGNTVERAIKTENNNVPPTAGNTEHWQGNGPIRGRLVSPAACLLAVKLAVL